MTTQRNWAISIFMLIVFFALCKVYFKKVFSHKEVLSSEFTIHTQCQYNGNVLSNVHNNHCNVCTICTQYTQLSRKMAVDGYNAQCSRILPIWIWGLLFSKFTLVQILRCADFSKYLALQIVQEEKTQKRHGVQPTFHNIRLYLTKLQAYDT